MTKSHLALLIEPKTRSIRIVSVNRQDGIGSLYKLLGCEDIHPELTFKNGDTIFINGEVSLEGNQGKFYFNEHLITGKAIILNEDPYHDYSARLSNWSAPRTSLKELIESVSFEPKGEEPEFETKDILHAIMVGKFQFMGKDDYMLFSGAAEGSLICYDMQGWTVIVSMGEPDEEAITVHAYLPEAVDNPHVAGQFTLTSRGWEVL